MSTCKVCKEDKPLLRSGLCSACMRAIPTKGDKTSASYSAGASGYGLEANIAASGETSEKLSDLIEKSIETAMAPFKKTAEAEPETETDNVTLSEPETETDSPDGLGALEWFMIVGVSIAVAAFVLVMLFPGCVKKLVTKSNGAQVIAQGPATTPTAGLSYMGGYIP